MYDGVTAIWSVIRETLTAVPDLLLYINLDGAKASIDSGGNIETGKFQEVFGALSKYQPQSTLALLEESHKSMLCFKELTVGVGRSLGHYRSMTPDFNATRLRELADLLLNHLPRYDLLNSSCQYRVTVLDRQGSRQILNIQGLAAEIEHALSREGMSATCVTIAALETMNMSAQFHLMRSTKILVGVDSTGLLNAAFMPKYGGCVHIKPFFQELFDRGKEGEMKALCTKMSGQWRSWTNSNLSSNVFPDLIKPEWVEMADAAQHNETILEELREQLESANMHGFFLSRQPKMYVDPVPIARMVQDIVHETKDGCSEL